MLMLRSAKLIQFSFVYLSSLLVRNLLQQLCRHVRGCFAEQNLFRPGLCRLDADSGLMTTGFYLQYDLSTNDALCHDCLSIRLDVNNEITASSLENKSATCGKIAGPSNTGLYSKSVDHVGGIAPNPTPRVHSETGVNPVSKLLQGLNCTPLAEFLPLQF